MADEKKAKADLHALKAEVLKLKAENEKMQEQCSEVQEALEDEYARREQQLEKDVELKVWASCGRCKHSLVALQESELRILEARDTEAELYRLGQEKAEQGMIEAEAETERWRFDHYLLFMWLL